MTAAPIAGVICLVLGAVFGFWSLIVSLSIMDDVNAVLPPERKMTFLTNWRVGWVYATHRALPCARKVRKAGRRQVLSVAFGISAWLLLTVLRRVFAG